MVRATSSSVCALLTTFNRRVMTLRCLARLEDEFSAADLCPQAILVDDSSIDGTAAAVCTEFPWVRVILGDGGLFWCRGMHLAFATAMTTGYDHYLWLNDDTLLQPGALQALLACHQDLASGRAAPLIVVGSTCDPETGIATYGGERRSRPWRPLRFSLIAPTGAAQPCDSMNGNVALISAAAAARTGNLDPRFEHAMGDTDFALRARRCGVEIWLAPNILGWCRANGVEGTYRDASLTLGERWHKMLDRKGLPWQSWLRFTRRHGGLLWPLAFCWPYLKLAASSLRPRPARTS